MSENKVMLDVLCTQIESHDDEPEALTKFELVTIRHDSRHEMFGLSGDAKGNDLKCWMCLGTHYIWFIRSEIDSLYKKLRYLDIQTVITDENSQTRFKILLEVDAATTGWDPPAGILVSSQYRDEMVELIGICWQAEYMAKRYEVRKFPLYVAKITETQQETDNLKGFGTQDDIEESNMMMKVEPPKGYEDAYRHKGYKFWLREGFKDVTTMKSGTYKRQEGWTVPYNNREMHVPPGVQITVHVHDSQSMMDLDTLCLDDIRTMAMQYKQQLTESLDQFYIFASAPYLKKMNRSNDIASWDCWQLFIRSKEYSLACVLCRREYIPPLCDTSQDIVVLLRCPAVGKMSEFSRIEMTEVLLDECCFVADSLAPIAVARAPYRDMIQERLNALQFSEENYRWIKGRLNLVPCHEYPAAYKFVKSIAMILEKETVLFDDDLLAQLGNEIPELKQPNSVVDEMKSDAEPLIVAAKKLEEARQAQRALSRSATSGGHKEDGNAKKISDQWVVRIQRYLAYCLDGGLFGDRFNIRKLVDILNSSVLQPDQERIVKRDVIEQLLQVRNSQGRFINVMQFLMYCTEQPEEFEKCTCNDSVMRTLLTEPYMSNVWTQKCQQSGLFPTFNVFLGAMLSSDLVAISTRTLICRQLLDQPQKTAQDSGELGVPKGVQDLVPSLVKVMSGDNLSLTACATAAMVNLSCNNFATKNFLISKKVVQICMKQLKQKDDELTLYTLYLLVNLTKTPHHRSIVVSNGGVPLLVDILTSSYQNTRKQKILAEVASVLGQLCNEKETRDQISDYKDQAVIHCLLWVYDTAPLNSKLKSKLLFTLRQLCADKAVATNKSKIGQHVIFKVLDELGQTRSGHSLSEECASNALLLLQILAEIHSNAIQMDAKLTEALDMCGLKRNERYTHRFGPALERKAIELEGQIKVAQAGENH